MSSFVKDLRHAGRRLTGSLGFTMTAVLTLGLGLGAVTTVFSLVYGVLLRPLPYPGASQLIRVFEVGSEGRRAEQMSDPNFVDFSELNQSLTGMAQYQLLPGTVSGGLEPIRVEVAQVSRDFFSVLGTSPALGRLFLPEEQKEGAGYAAVMSHSFWQRYLNGEPDLGGQTLRFGDQIVTLVGVMPPEFTFPQEVDLWIPRELEAMSSSRTALNKKVVARVAPGRSLDFARDDLDAIAQRLNLQYGKDTWMQNAAVSSLQEDMTGGVRQALLIFQGASCLLLLIACANVVNLLLANAAARERELAVRLSLGASRARLFRQFFAETLLLSFSGGLLGYFVSRWALGLLRGLEGGAIPRLAEVKIGTAVFVFFLVISAVVAFFLALLTTWRAVRGGSRVALGTGQRTQTADGGTRVRGSLVVSQVAMTLVLLVGTGLLLRSFRVLLATDPGFRTGGALVLNCQLPYATTPEEAERQKSLHLRLIDRLSSIPGVEGVGGINYLPLKTSGPSGSFLLLNRPDEVQSWEDFGAMMKIDGRSGYANYRRAVPGYFELMKIPLKAGRFFDARDQADSAHVALVSESLARDTWPGENPIGKLVQFGNMDGDLRPLSIVGVVGDVRARSLESEPRPVIYANSLQRDRALSGPYDLVIDARRDPSLLHQEIRQAVRGVDPQVAPVLQSLEQVFAGSLAQRRFQFVLLSTLGGLSLLLAAVGLYGLIAFQMAQRRQEIGVRLALGASRPSVVSLFVKDGLRLAGVGVLFGLLAAFAATRFMTSLLYGITTTDPLTFGAVALLLISVALAASFIPAYRASRTDPAQAMQPE
ncbi:MAG: ABC transporter permease [Acidobacteriota bacterium]